MGQTHPSTPAERAQWAAYLLAHQGDYGVVTHISRTYKVARPTLYAWRAHAAQVLLTAFEQPEPGGCHVPGLSDRQIVGLWISHVSTRGIQAASRELVQQGVSLATITAVLHDAQQRALAWMHSHVPSTPRALALDEIYATDRRGAYLNVVDV